MNTTIALLAVAILAGAAVQAADAPVARPAWQDDEHNPPIHASPTNYSPPTASQFTNLVAMPPVTNWPATSKPHPHMTNWPATNLPAMTNPPSLQPPGG